MNKHDVDLSVFIFLKMFYLYLINISCTFLFKMKLKYWLKFIKSSLSMTQKSKFKIVLVGTHLDQLNDVTIGMTPPSDTLSFNQYFYRRMHAKHEMMSSKCNRDISSNLTLSAFD